MAGEFSDTTYTRTTPNGCGRRSQSGVLPASLGHAIESEWQKGSSYIRVEAGLRIEDPEQVIVESDPCISGWLSHTTRHTRTAADRPGSRARRDHWRQAAAELPVAGVVRHRTGRGPGEAHPDPRWLRPGSPVRER